MKGSILPIFLSLACLCSHVTANIELGPFPDVVQVGETYTLNWTATGIFDFTIWLIHEALGEGEYSWTKVDGLGGNLRSTGINGSYTWTVPPNLTDQGNYGFWIDGFALPYDGANEWNQTNWFQISSSTSPTSSASASGSPSATASATSGIASSTASTGLPSETSSGAPSSSRHSSLSGGAIAGIVIGCLVVLALVIGAIPVFLWHRKRSAVKKREAAARASRLAPVMQESSPAYEMHIRNPPKS